MCIKNDFFPTLVTKVVTLLAVTNNVFLQCVVSTVFGNLTRTPLFHPSAICSSSL